MAEDWFLDVQKYAADADRNVVQKIVNYLGIALRNRDSSLVSFSDPQEVDRVRTNYLQKKLGLADSDDKLNAGLDWVKNLMSGDRTKNRVTVYYLLAHYFGKLDLFGGASGTSAASLGAGAGAASAAIIGGAAAVASVTPLRSEAAPPAATPSGADEIPVYPTPSTSRTSTGSTLGQGGSPSRPAYVADTEDDDRGGGGWPKWLTWLLVALAVIALFFLLRSCMAEKSSVTPNAASTAPASTGEAGLGANTNAASGNAQVAAATDVPTGAGVVSGERDSKPMLTVYFDTGKADVSKDMASAAATLTAYLNAHPGSKLAVSGYNDPSGNAAVNAALSKKRAQAVAAALASAGVPEASVQLVKPADTTTTTVTPEQARRVEITVQQ